MNSNTPTVKIRVVPTADAQRALPTMRAGYWMVRRQKAHQKLCQPLIRVIIDGQQSGSYWHQDLWCVPVAEVKKLLGMED